MTKAEIITQIRELLNELEVLDISNAGQAQLPLQQGPAQAPAAEEKKVELAEVRNALVPLTKAGRKEEVRALLESYGASKLTDLKPEDYAAVLKKAEALNA